MLASISHMHSHKVFKDRSAAEKVVSDWDDSSFRINVDDKSGRAIIEILDEETGEILGLL